VYSSTLEELKKTLEIECRVNAADAVLAVTMWHNGKLRFIQTAEDEESLRAGKGTV